MTQIREKNKNMHSTNLMKNTYDRVTPRTNLMSERRSTEVIQSHPGRIIKTDQSEETMNIKEEQADMSQT